MLISKHIMLSLIVSVMIYPFFGIYTIIFFLSSFLMDIDHYIEYVIDKKDFNLSHAYNHFMKGHHKRKENIKKNKQNKNNKINIHIFHLIEIVILIIILSWFNKIFFYIALGIIFHIILDLIDYLYIKHIKKAKLDHCGRCYSLISYLFKRE